jgi:hypothetical protein
MLLRPAAKQCITCLLHFKLTTLDPCRSVFYLPKPRPLSHLVGDLWRGPTLVLQGALDPLNDAKGACKQIVSLTRTQRLYPHMVVCVSD